MGCDIAQHIASAGKKATIVSDTGWKNRRNCWVFYSELPFELLGKLDVVIEPELDYREITDDGILTLDKNGNQRHSATLLLANGLKLS